MTSAKPLNDAPATTDPAEAPDVAQGDAGSAPEIVERLLAHIVEAAAVPAPEPAPIPAPAPVASADTVPALRTARVTGIVGGQVQILWRGRGTPLTAKVDEGVDRELVSRAMVNGDAVLVEVEAGSAPVIVGVIQTRIPATMELKAQKVVIDAEQEVLLKAGRAAMRLREDGDVEVVGSRILTASRGLFRIVGRVLRLN
jgi:hypothetical protein